MWQQQTRCATTDELGAKLCGVTNPSLSGEGRSRSQGTTLLRKQVTMQSVTRSRANEAKAAMPKGPFEPGA